MSALSVESRHCEERSDAAIQTSTGYAALLRLLLRFSCCALRLSRRAGCIVASIKQSGSNCLDSATTRTAVQNIFRERMQALESTGFFGFFRMSDLKIKAQTISRPRHSCEGRNPPLDSLFLSFPPRFLVQSGGCQPHAFAGAGSTLA